MIQVLCGFPGVGKSTLFRELEGKQLICDSDSSTFDKSQFPQNYIAHIQQKIAEGYVVLCSTHEIVRVALVRAGIKYAIAYPTFNAKHDYAMRYKKRGSPEAFRTLMDQQWDNFLTSCTTDSYAALHIVVPEYCFIDKGVIRQMLLFEVSPNTKLSPQRREAVQRIINSMPLGERQRQLAQETLEDMDDAEADKLITLHAKLIEGLPKALEAIRRVRQEHNQEQKQ